MTNKKRLRNYGLWTSIVAQVLLILQLGGVLFGYTITDEVKTEVIVFVDAVLVLLATLGIISNPTKPDSQGYNL